MIKPPISEATIPEIRELRVHAHILPVGHQDVATDIVILDPILQSDENPKLASSLSIVADRSDRGCCLTCTVAAAASGGEGTPSSATPAVGRQGMVRRNPPYTPLSSYVFSVKFEIRDCRGPNSSHISPNSTERIHCIRGPLLLPPKNCETWSTASQSDTLAAADQQTVNRPGLLVFRSESSSSLAGEAGTGRSPPLPAPLPHAPLASWFTCHMRRERSNYSCSTRMEISSMIQHGSRVSTHDFFTLRLLEPHAMRQGVHYTLHGIHATLYLAASWPFNGFTVLESTRPAHCHKLEGIKSEYLRSCLITSPGKDAAWGQRSATRPGTHNIIIIVKRSGSQQRYLS
ncbi:hypothetical protein RRG08_065609 [Elysia crispata]|uniref:Uncharacterized protein n=1 Tax=Elysia crispata TaxID=231223 RepID=A0AAE1D1F2_9GAST|nr:hypothetical protein RRG08_065609 [Elysia crispata]